MLGGEHSKVGMATDGTAAVTGATKVRLDGDPMTRHVAQRRRTDMGKSSTSEWKAPAEAPPAESTQDWSTMPISSFWGKPLFEPPVHKPRVSGLSPPPLWTKIRLPKFGVGIGVDERCVRVFYAENPSWLYSDIVVPTACRWSDVVEFMAHNGNINDEVFCAQTLADQMTLPATAQVSEWLEAAEVVLVPRIPPL